MLIQSPSKGSENKESPAVPFAEPGKPRQNPHHTRTKNGSGE